MGGCSILIFLPFIIGFTAAVVVLYAALWIYIVYALVVLALSAVGYVIATKKGLFKRYTKADGWKHGAVVLLQWFLRFEMAFYAITGALAIAFEVYLALR